MSQRNTKLGGEVSPNTMLFDLTHLETFFQLLCSPVSEAQLLTQLNALTPKGQWRLQTSSFPYGQFPIDPLPESLPAQTFLLHYPYKAQKRLCFQGMTLSNSEAHLMSVFVDCYNQRLSQLAQYRRLQCRQDRDTLTQLPNQGAFQLALKHATEQTSLPVGMMVLDINGLKWINDTQGHMKGDALLKKVAKFLVKICRQNDEVFRIGGDEFVILLHKGTIQRCRALSDRIECQKSSVFSPSTPWVGVSIGWACSQLHDKNQLFNIADKNMYCQKRRFYNRFFSKVLN